MGTIKKETVLQTQRTIGWMSEGKEGEGGKEIGNRD